MSYLDRIAECNTYDLSGFRPFVVAGTRVGWVRHAFSGLLAEFPAVFALDDTSVQLQPQLDDFERRSRAVAPVLRALHARGVIHGFRDELYPVTTGFTAEPLLAMERAAIPHFGVRAYGVHINGYVRRDDGLHMWVARRSRNKPTYPSLLDNMVAGGQPIGVSLLDNLVKECREEAGMPAALARRAQPVGVVTYCAEIPEGLQPDAQFCYDLELPPEFVPHNTDGEVEAFMLWPIEQVAEVVRETERFKYNCNLVIIDFLIRHGILPPDDPDYVAIAQGRTR